MNHLKGVMQRLDFSPDSALVSLDRTESSVNLLQWTLRDCDVQVCFVILSVPAFHAA